MEWVIKAAQKGHVKAQLSLAWFHLLGYGVPQSFYEAYKWMYVILTVDCR
ncbi:sel1 repeat family protein [archaeon]|nr:MAG: sel1 repeat family protein [archaeon]